MRPMKRASSTSVFWPWISQEETAFTLRPNLNDRVWITLARCATIAALVTAIVFGATGKVFGIHIKLLFGTTVDQDTQLAAIGFFNKLLDLLVQKSLENSAFVCLTIWMTSPAAQGARLDDFALKDELTKPWYALWCFAKRRRIYKWADGGWRDFWRLLVTLATSISVLLLAVAVNTLGPPKLRWYPHHSNLATLENAYLSMSHPRMIFNALDWDNAWYPGFKITGGGPLSWAADGALTAASTLTALSTLVDLYQTDPIGWLQNTNDIAAMTAIDTSTKGPSIDSLSVQSWMVTAMFEEQRDNGPAFARKSLGFNGDLYMTLPTLSTRCYSQDTDNVSSPPFSVLPPSPRYPTSFSVNIGRSLNGNFSGATCQLHFSQALFPVKVWIVDNQSPDLSINGFGQAYHNNLTRLSVQSIDPNITQALSSRLASTLSSFNSILPNTSTADLLTLTARLVRDRRPQSFSSDAAALTPVIALLSQHLLGIASWNATQNGTEEMIESRNMQYQVYGAGPRLPIEWLTVIVITVILLTQLYGLAHDLFCRVAPAPWLEVGGMLVAANTAPRLTTFEESTDGESPAVSKARFYMRATGLGTASLTDCPRDYLKEIVRRKEYTYL